MSWNRSLAGGSRWREAALVAMAAVPLAGCSGGGAPSVESAQEVATTVTDAPTTTAKPVVESTIEVRLVIDGQPREDTVDRATIEGTDPFGRFGSCSGLRKSFGAYEMLVSGSEALGGSVQVNATTNPHEAGTVPASARIETEEATLDVDGTLDLSEDYRSGRFLGETGDDNRVVIEFDCTSKNTPAPLDRTRPYVDIAMLMVKDDQQRLLSLGLAAPCDGDGIDGAVPKKEKPSGGLSRAVISGDRLKLFIGGEALKLADSSVTATSATAGTFYATTDDGTTITGAYSCRV